MAPPNWFRISCGRGSGQVVEEVVGARDRIAMEMKERAVELVGSAFCHQGDLGAGGAPLVGIGIDRRDPELADRIGCGAQHRGEGKPVDLIVDIHAIERDVGLIAASASHIAISRDPWLQTQERGHVPPLQGELFDLLFDEVIAQAGILAVDDGIQ